MRRAIEHHEKSLRFSDPVNKNVIDDSARGKQHMAVNPESLVERPLQVSGDEVLDNSERARAFDHHLSHVRNVEEAGGVPRGLVLVDDARVLNGKLPSVKIDEL